MSELLNVVVRRFQTQTTGSQRHLFATRSGGRRANHSAMTHPSKMNWHQPNEYVICYVYIYICIYICVCVLNKLRPRQIFKCIFEMKMYVFRLNFHWSLFLKDQLRYSSIGSNNDLVPIKQSRSRWFETPWRSLWRQCNGIYHFALSFIVNITDVNVIHNIHIYV